MNGAMKMTFFGLSLLTALSIVVLLMGIRIQKKVWIGIALFLLLITLVQWIFLVGSSLFS